MKIAIIGCGWVGIRLAAYLKNKKHFVLATTTTPEKIPALEEVAHEVHLLDFSTTQNFEFLNEVDVAVFSMPISRESWRSGFEKFQKAFPKTILFSSTGVYPTADQTFTEKDTENLRPDILAAENLVQTKYPQTNILRFGGLMGDERALRNFFKNRTPENPHKRTNYIHYEDILPIVELVMESERRGEIYNVVAPEHPSLGEILNIETDGAYISSQKNSNRIISSDHLIQDFNYTFIHPNPKYF